MQRHRLSTDPEAPPLAQAAALALGVLKAAGATRWAELEGVLPSTVELSAGQRKLLDDHALVVELLRLAGRRDDGSRTPTVTVAVCPACSEWVLVSGPAPSRCEITFGCSGTPRKASVAKREPI